VTGITADRATAILARVRARRPLVHHITNFVTAGAVADLTLALVKLTALGHVLVTGSAPGYEQLT